MKQLLLSALAASALIASASAQLQNNQTMAPGKVPFYTYDQKSLAGLPVIIDPQQAKVIVDEFRGHYAAIGNPRILVYVQGILPSDVNIATNRPALLAERQTLSDVQRLVSRPLLNSGATLVDMGATNQISDAVSAFIDDKSDRDVVGRVADVVIEAYVSSRTVTTKDSSGPKTLTFPELTLTAIRVKDAKILGQVSASDLLSRAGGPGYVARNFKVQDVSEPSALALMDATLRVNN